jgi:hypothetical protein
VLLPCAGAGPPLGAHFLCKLVVSAGASVYITPPEEISAADMQHPAEEQRCPRCARTPPRRADVIQLHKSRNNE